MIGGIVLNDKFSSHKGMQVAAGLIAAESELTAPVGDELNLTNFVPVGVKLALVVGPGVLEICQPLLLYHCFQIIAIQQEAVGNVHGCWSQDHRVTLLDYNPTWLIAVLFCSEINDMSVRLMWQQPQR